MPNPMRNLARWRDVQAVLVRYGFETLFDRDEIVEVRHWLQDHLHLAVGEFSDRTTPERLRMMLTDLGPTYVKMGQILSSRSDLMPPDWVAELSKLQDDVPPFLYEDVRQIIQQELNAVPEDIFASFDPEPIAAASIGQVHHAVLKSGESVVVKVQRPNIRAQVQADMEMMRRVASLMEGRTALGKRIGAVGVVDEFAQSLNDEMDYRNEAANADRLRYNLRKYSGVHVPEIYWDWVTPRVLTMEAVQGVKINDLEQLDANGIDKVELADVFIRTIFQQLMIDGFFHADPHPGNLFVDLTDGTLIYIDLGMMGSLIAEQREQLGQIVQCILRRDSREIVRVVLQIGIAFEPVKEVSLRRSVDRIINRYLNASLEQISFAEMMSDILGTILQHGIRLPSEFSLAIKTLIQGEQVGRTLDPQIQIVDIVRTISQQMTWERLDPRNIMAGLGDSLRETRRLSKSLPRAVEELLRQMESGALHIGLDIPDFIQQVRHVYVITNRLTAGLILAGMIIGSAIAMGVSPTASWKFIPIIGIIGFVSSMVVGGFLVADVFFDLWNTRRKK